MRIFIVTEGQNTEPVYFRALKKVYPGVVIEVHGAAVMRHALINKAMRFADDRAKSAGAGRKDTSLDKKDQIWAVLDIDGLPDGPRGIDQAIQAARRSGIRVAWSNPCFELWLILHLQAYDKQGRTKDVQKFLQSLRPEYDPSERKIVDCAALIPCVRDAETRAEKQLSRRDAEGASFGIPSTTVFHLTREIRTASDRWTDRFSVGPGRVRG